MAYFHFFMIDEYVFFELSLYLLGVPSSTKSAVFWTLFALI